MAQIARSQLQLGPVLATGGQGVIHELPQRPGAVAKVYRKKKLSREGVHLTPGSSILMLRIADAISALTPQEGALLAQHTAWPSDVIVDDVDGSLVGVVMPRIHKRYFQQYGGGDVGPRHSQHLMFDARANELSGGVPHPAERERLRLYHDLAQLLMVLHQREVCYGDLNPNNILWTLQPRPAVMLCDCDGVRFKGNQACLPQANFPDWFAPEGGQYQTQETDLYKYGLFVLRTILPGPPGRVLSAVRAVDGVTGSRRSSASPLAAALLSRGSILDRALRRDPKERPPMRLWVKFWRQVARAGQ